MTPNFYGVNRQEALFTVGQRGVLVNTRNLTASSVDAELLVSKKLWRAPAKTAPVQSWKEVAEAALSLDQSEVTVVSAATSNRAYTIPKAVRKVATKGMQDSIREGIYRTPTAVNVARALSAGGQVSIKEIRYISRFFERNDSTSIRPAHWNMWGGDASKTWTEGVLKSQPVTAGADAEVNLLSFYDGDETDRTFFGEYTPNDTDLNAPYEHVVALYKKTPQDTWLAWGDGDWFDCDTLTASGDRLVELDDDTALYVASSLYDAPDSLVSLRDFDPEEWDIVQGALAGVDWDMVERAMTPEAFAAAGTNINEYTPEERARNASQQPRDANGRFASVGDTGVTRSGLHGKITSVNPLDGTLIVTAVDGNSYAIAARDFTIDDPATTQSPDLPSTTPPPKLNLDQILAQPRATSTTPKAFLKSVLQPMGAAQIKQVITDYQGFINRERAERAKDFRGGTGWNERRRRENSADTDTEFNLNERPTPENSDVPAMYLAIVDREDPQAVMDLVAMVPASSTSEEVTTYKRVAGSWVEDAKILQDMRSPTPPPVVKLDEATYAEVLQQVDTQPPLDVPENETQTPTPAPSAPAATPAPAAPTAAPPVAASIDFEPACIFGWDENGNLCAIVAAGGFDRNRGNAEQLREYWLYGKGALKIRWGTGGDWTRCVRHLSKYLGVRAKGYCALRHKEATGMWTGDRRHRTDYSLVAGGERIFSTTDIRRTNQVILASADEARRQVALQKVYGNADAISPIPVGPDAGQLVTDDRIGRRFKIPLVIPEGLESGDGRMFEKGSLSLRTFPLPLLWQIKTGEGHDGSFVVGRVDNVERTENGLGNAYGYFDIGPYGQEAQRLVENQMLRWVSADLDKFEAEELELAEDEDAGLRKLRVKKGRLMGITLVAKPAFQECTIELEPEFKQVPIENGTYEGETPVAEPTPIMAAATIADHIPVEPPKVWFDRPVLNGPTPLTVTDEGQVFGHIATWQQSHIGRPDVLSAPRSRTNYSYFHTGVLRTQDGVDVPVGQLTLAGGHAGPYDDVLSAVKHYDDTGSAVADVHAGEDTYGIWVAGALRPGTTPQQVRALRASAPSGDWRPVNGHLELVAVCQVNVPGFPVPRATVASGAMYSLVAAGTAELVRLAHPEVSAEMTARIAKLEQAELERDQKRAEAAFAMIKQVRDEKEAENEQLASLAASARDRVYKVLDVDGYLTEFKAFSPQRREKLANEKKALKDGCLSGDTKVVTPTGDIEIKDLLGPQVLLTDQGWVEAEVRNFGVRELFTVTLERAGVLKRIQATEAHRWYTSDGSIKLTSDLERFDRIPFFQVDSTSADSTEVSDSSHSTRTDASDLCHLQSGATAHGLLQAAQGVGSGSSRLQVLHDRSSEGKFGSSVERPRSIREALLEASGGSIAKEVRNYTRGLRQDDRGAAGEVRTVWSSRGGPKGSVGGTSRRSLPHYESGSWTSMPSMQLDAGSGRGDWAGQDRSVLGWRVVSVKASGRSEEVYCGVVPELHRFILADGVLTGNSFPIENAADLRRAIRAYGRAEESKQAAVRRHIVRRARALDKTDMIPDNWSEASLTDLALEANDHREVLTAALMERKLNDLRKQVRGA